MTKLSGDKAARQDSLRQPVEGPQGAQVTPPSVPVAEQAKSRRKAPTVQQVLERCKSDRDFWQQRNQRMQRHQDLFDLVEKSSKEGQILVYLNDPKVLVRKISGLIARRQHRIEVPPRGEENAERAQRIENGCRWWDKQVSVDWSEDLHNPLRYDEAQSLLLRGWVCERIMLNPDDEAFVDCVLFDPFNVYPRLSGKRIRRVTHAFEATIEELIETFPECADQFADQDETQKKKCFGYYENVEPYWYCVVTADSETFIKKPVKLEYFSWDISIAQGAFSHHAIADNPVEEQAAKIGEGFLDSIEGIYKLMNKFVTILANAANKQENPPKLVTTINGEPKEVDLSAGAENTLIVGEGLQVLPTGVQIGQFMPLLTTLQDRLNKGSIPGAMFGEGTALNSGFMSALMMGAAQDTLWTFIEALGLHHTRRYQRFLELFKKFADRPLPIVAKAAQPNNKDLAGKRVWGELLSVEDVEVNGTYVEVTYEDITPQDRVALGQLAALLVREKLISLFTARGKYLGLDDPELENNRVLAELVNLNEDAVKKLAMLSLKILGRDKELGALMDALNQEEVQKAAAANPQLQAGNPAGQGPGQGPMMGLAPNTLPPEAAGLPGTQPNDAELLAAMLSGGMPGM